MKGGGFDFFRSERCAEGQRWRVLSGTFEALSRNQLAHPWTRAADRLMARFCSRAARHYDRVSWYQWQVAKGRADKRIAETREST